MSKFLPKGLPGTSFARYLSNQQEAERKRNKPVGLFNDIEAQAIKDAAKDYDYEQNYPQLIQEIKDVTGRVDVPKLRYKGLLDGRIPRPFPGPAKEGSFWVVEYPGTIGSFYDVQKGDVIVRFSLNEHSDWLLIASGPAPENFTQNTKEDYDTALKVTQKHLKLLKADLSKQSKPRTKAAPGPQKRKVILEDDE